MRVKDILHICDSSTNVAILDTTTDLYIFPPDNVGFWLYPDHWVHDEEVVGFDIKDNVLILSVEVE